MQFMKVVLLHFGNWLLLVINYFYSEIEPNWPVNMTVIDFDSLILFMGVRLLADGQTNVK